MDDTEDPITRLTFRERLGAVLCELLSTVQPDALAGLLSIKTKVVTTYRAGGFDSQYRPNDRLECARHMGAKLLAPICHDE